MGATSKSFFCGTRTSQDMLKSHHTDGPSKFPQEDLFTANPSEAPKVDKVEPEAGSGCGYGKNWYQ